MFDSEKETVNLLTSGQLDRTFIPPVFIKLYLMLAL